jgi:hypothetical protein
MRRSPWLLACVVALAVGCNAGTEPYVSSGGVWDVAFHDLTNSHGTTCTRTGTVVTLTHTGDSLTGSYSQSDVVCPTWSARIPGGMVFNGTAPGDRVDFNLWGAELVHLQGRVRGDSMTGAATWHYSSDGPPYIGTWSATRR